MKKVMLLLICSFLSLFVFSKPLINGENISVKDIHQQIYCLAEAVYFEARGEDVKGQEAVAHVILNRTNANQFPSDVCSVISQKGQFQWYANKKLRKGRKFRPEENKDIMKLASDIYISNLLGQRKDMTNLSFFFSSNGKKPSKNIVRSVKVGRHQFYKFDKVYYDNYIKLQNI